MGAHIYATKIKLGAYRLVWASDVSVGRGTPHGYLIGSSQVCPAAIVILIRTPDPQKYRKLNNMIRRRPAEVIPGACFGLWLEGFGKLELSWVQLSGASAVISAHCSATASA